MKKYLFAISAALLSLAACNKEIEIDNPVKNNYDTSALTFTSQRPQLAPVTATSWNGSAIVWTEGEDKIKVGFTFDGDWWAQTDVYGSESASPNNHKKFYQSDAVDIDGSNASVGTFSVPATFTGPASTGDFVFYAVYPSTAMSENSQDGAPTVSVTLKSTQTPLSNSFDGSADLMVGKSATINSTGLPTDPIGLNWTRVVAHGLFTLKDFQNVVGGETIEKVVFTAQDGANLTGKQSVNIANGTVTASDASNKITLEGTNLQFVTEETKTNLKVWLSVIPVTLTSLDVLVETNKATYTRSINSISKTLTGNACNKLAINMSSATRTPKAEYEWVNTNLSAITPSDIFVIVGNNGSSSNYAMSNDNGTGSAPSAVAVTVSNDKLSSAPADRLLWNLSVSSDSYTFYPNGTTETWLYCTNTNNGVRVGTNANSVFTLDGGYLKNSGTSRYVGVYDSQDWRCYTSNGGNIAGQSFAFYVRKASGSSPSTYAVTWNAPSETGCSIAAKVNSVNIASGDEFATGTEVTIIATAGSGYEFASWDVTGATVADASAATTTFTIGTSAVSVSATFNSTGISAITLPYEETFESDQGDFTIDNVALDGLTYVWSHDNSYKYMKASGYANSANHVVESWLISPLLAMPSSLSTGESIKLKFSQVISNRFGTVEDEATLMVKEEGGAWSKVTIGYPTFAGTYSSWDNQVIDLSSYVGKNIQFAFKYVGTSSNNGNWEIKNVSVKKYEPKALISISVSGQKTIFTKDDTFDFGGTVTATYNDETTADVTAEATFSGYNMSTTGEQTVTVSYIESGVTKTTTYTITVNSADVESVVYTLDGTTTGGSNGYDSESDITQNGISWKVMGNTTTNPWRIGGKSLSNVERTVYSTTALAKNISKIEITHGAASNVTVNSMTVTVSKNADFSNPVSTVTPTFVANGTVTVNRPDGKDWSNCYYKIVYNITISATSNKFIQFTQAEFTGK